MANQTTPAIQVKDSNVGIGTNNPTAKLFIEGNDITLNTEGSAQGKQLYFRYSNGANIQSDSYLYFSTGGSPTEKMRITDGGNVGIGTTAPGAKLTVYTGGASAISGTNDGIRLQVSSYNNSARNTIAWHQDGSDLNLGRFGLEWNSGTSQMNFVWRDVYNSGAGVSELMRLQGNGNLGIGTTAPGYKLDVSGTIRAGVAGNSSANIPALLVTSSGTGDAQAAIAIQQATSEGDTIIFADYEPYVEWGISTENAANKIQFTAGTSTGSLGSKTLYNNAGDARTAYIKFDHDLTSGQTLIGGNVGIGTTSPSYKLQVEGAGRFSNGASGTLIIKHNYGYHQPNWGIKLDGDTGSSGGYLSQYVDIGGFELAQGATYYGGGPWLADSNSTTYSAVVGNGGVLMFSTNSGLTAGGTFYPSERMRITAGGNVGIGTTAPGAKLQVEGANPFIRVNNTSADDHGIKISYNGSDAHGLHLLYNANSAVSYIDNTYQAVSGQVYGNIYIRQNVGGTMTSRITIKADGGNVGIGTTSPSDKLDVFGNQFLGDGTNNAQLYIRGVFGVSYAWTIKNLGSGLQIVSTSPSAGNGVNFDFGGNVGIGTTSPSEKLHVDGNVIVTYNNSFQGINSIGNKAILARVSPTTGIINYAEYATATNLNGFVMGSDDARVKGNIATDSLEFITNTSTRMTILSNGDVGINNTNPSRKLDVTGEARVVSTSNLAMFIKTSSGFGAGISYEDSTTGGNDVVYAGAIGAAFFIATGAAERVRVLSGGNVGIATNNPLSRLHVVGDARIASGSLGVGVAPNATDGRVDASNDIVAYSTSDQRLKENVMPIENALEKVKTLTGVEFDWKEKTAHVHGYHGHDVGIIAQDVQAVLPEAVRTNESGYLSVRYEKMIALLIEANKELAARVEELEKKLK